MGFIKTDEYRHAGLNEETERGPLMDETLFPAKSSKETKGDKLNSILTNLLQTCDTILAVIIADWQGLSFASKLPKDVNEEEISATTLFTLEGAEGTRKELEKSLLGNKLSYLILVTERENNPAYMIVFPIQNLGYIACISHTREDMGVIIQNMKTAAQEAGRALGVQRKPSETNVDKLLEPKYDNLMKKLEALKKVKLPFLESKPQPEAPTPVDPSIVPIMEVPAISGPPAPPTAPLEFLEVETLIEDIEPAIININLQKYQVIFLDSKNIKYTVIVEAASELDAQVRIKERDKYHPVDIKSISKLQ